jgi:hypothetical protein
MPCGYHWRHQSDLPLIWIMLGSLPVSGGKINASTTVKQMAGGDAHRLFTAAQNCSVTAALSSATFQPFVSASSFANLCSI